MESAAAIVQYFYSVLAAANYTALEYQPSYNAVNGSHFDFIIVGCGTAGSVLANRLSEVSKWTVLCIESGTAPSIYSQFPGFFPFLPHSSEDWDYYTENDGVTSQALKGKRVAATRGKVLGGSSSIDHTVYERGTAADYNQWTKAGGSLWNYDTMLKYFKKSERNIDPRLMNGATARYHSKTGSVTINEQSKRSVYEATESIIKEYFADLGIYTIHDINVPTANGTADISVTATKDGIRAGTAYEYIYSIKGKRNNFYWMEKSHVNKIIINKNNAAIGVDVQKNLRKIVLFAKKEVILSAGVFKSPKLLMLSGVGPKKNLKKFNITIVNNLPVGYNLKDHISVPVVTCGKRSTIYSKEELASKADLKTMPVPLVCGSYTLGNNSADMQVIALHFTPRSVLCKTLLSTDFNYEENIVDSIINQCGSREIFVNLVVSTKHKSSGNVTLRTCDPNDSPKIFTGYFGNSDDLDYMVKNLKLIYQLQDSSYFKSVGGYFSRPPLSVCDSYEFRSDEYWQCYAKTLASTTLHPSSTNAMGKVVDGNLKVKGVKKLRVCDDSVFPTIPSAKTRATTIAVAERLADLVKKDYNKLKKRVCS